MSVQKIMDAIPDYDAFLTVDELNESIRQLAKDYPDTVTLIDAGASANKSPLYCLKIGNGSVNALAFACPHPNEPIGAMTLHCFSAWLARDRELREALGCTWYLVLCIDPDGTRLNEGWFKGPFTLLNYARNYFRPAINRQVEWTFPVDYKNLHFHSPIPETQALMRLIDEIQPQYMFSLHNSGFGGAFWYLSEDRPRVYNQLSAVAERYGVPLSLGEPELPCCTPYAPAVYRMFNIRDLYDYYEQYVCPEPEKALTNGDCSDGYAKRTGKTFTMMIELPYFYDSRVNDTSLTRMNRRDAILRGCEIYESVSAFLEAGLKSAGDFIPNENPYKLITKDFIEMARKECSAKRNWALSNEELNTPAKSCEAFDNLEGSRFYSLLNLGLYVRMLREELQKPCSEKKSTALKTALAQGNAEFEAIGRALENSVDYRVIPIKSLVGIQLESIIIAVQNGS